MAGGFDALGCMPELIKAVTELGWYLPTDVQDEAIPLILGGGDVMVAAETGSGKTAAFALPVIQCCVETLRVKTSSSSSTPADSKRKLDAISQVVTISESDKDPLLQLTPPDFLSTNALGSKSWVGARATHGVKGPGKYYYEAMVQGNGLSRLGWSSISANLELGKDIHGYGYGGTAMKSNNNQFEAYGVKFSNGDVIGCCIDLNEGSISYMVNGQSQGTAHTLDANTPRVYFPAFSVRGANVSLNFGGNSFQFVPPEGYLAVQHADEHLISAQGGGGVSEFSGGPRSPLAVIIEPVKDLAEQVYRDILSLSQYIQNPTLHSMVLVGGDDFKKQQKQITSGVDILICTPQKAADFVKKGILDFSKVKFFILDEADSLASDQDSMTNVNYLYNSCPVGGAGDTRLQVCFFSATLHSPAITQLAKQICVNPSWVDLKGPNSIPDSVHHVVYRLDFSRDSSHLSTASTQSKTDGIHELMKEDETSAPSESYLIKRLKPLILLKIIDKFNMSQCMIFCRTNLDCEVLEEFFCSLDGGSKKFTHAKETGKESKYSCSILGGMKSMTERRASLEAFKEGSLRFLICTDVAARGIDVKGLPFVVNYTLPDEPESYIHRIGRVGRAECLGLAVSIVAPPQTEERVWYHVCSNRGRGCTNTKLKSEGGCTTLYNEPDYFEAIQRRLDLAIPELSADFELPESLAVLGVRYGEKMQAEETIFNAHLQLIEPTVRELATMEFESQNIFLRFPNLFGKQ